jgi:hypothetical protein
LSDRANALPPVIHAAFDERVGCAIRSHFSSARKHGLNVMDFIKTAFAGAQMDFADE